MNNNQEVKFGIAITNAPQAVQDIAAVGTAVNKLEKGAEQAGKAGKEMGEGLDQAALSGKKLAANNVWNSYKSGAAGAVSSTETLAKSLGNLRTISNASHLKGYNAEIDRLSKLSGLSSSAMGGLVRQMDTVRRNRALDELRQTAELSTLQFARLQAGAGNATGAMKTLGQGAMAAKVFIAAVGAVVLLVGKACFDAALQMDRLTKAYTSITGSSQGARVQLASIYEISNRLGLQFQTIAESAKGFFAAGKGTSLEGELNNIFEGVSKAGTALSLSQDQVQGVFLALGQMISKGTVQAEELRGQLGERLPGAFQLAAKAMGVTTGELSKMLELGQVTAEDMLPKLARELHNTYTVGAVQAADGAQAAVNRLSTEWGRFKAEVGNSDFLKDLINDLSGVFKILADDISRARTEAELARKGVLGEDTWRTMDGRKVGSSYSDKQIETYQAQGSLDPSTIRATERERELKSSYAESAMRTEKTLSDAARTYAESVKNTLDTKNQKINGEFDAAIKAQLAAKTLNAENSGVYDQRIAAINAERKRQLSELDKTGKAADRTTESFVASISKMREANDAFEGNLVQSGDKLAVAAEKAQQKYALAIASIESELEKARKSGVSVENQEAYRLEATRKAELELEQERVRIDNDRAEREQKNADMRLDFEKRYADMLGLTSDTVKKGISTQYNLYKDAGVDLLRLEEWKQDQIQRASRKGLDGAQVALRDYAAEASNQAKAINDSFSGLFRGLDQGFNTMWEQLLTSGKASFSDFKKLFASFLADIAHMAFTRPIVVQIAGALSGVFGTAGMAGAAGSGATGGSGGMGGLLGNIPFSSFLPDSWMGGLSGFLGTSLPGTGTSLSVLTPSGTQVLGNIGGLGLGSALLAGGLGGLGYGLLGGALGLPQNKYTGFTSTAGGALGAFGGSALAGSSGLALGATAGSVFPVVGTVIGALAGGLLGGLFGKKDKRIPSTNTTVRDVSLLGTDWGTIFNERQGGAKMSSAETAQIWGPLGDIASQTVAGFETFANALPAEYARVVMGQLRDTRVSMGEGVNGDSFKIRPGDNLESDMKRVGEQIQRALFTSFQDAVGRFKLSDVLGLSMDLSSGAGIERAVQGVTAWKEVSGAIDATLKPVAALTAQTNAANSQMTAWIDSLRALGWQERKLAEIEAQRAGYIEAITFQLRTQFDMEMTLREATLRGTGELVSAQQSLWSDWQSIVANFGAGSEQAKRWQAYQSEALPKLAEELAKSQYQSQIDSLKQQAEAFRQVAEQLTSLRSGLRTDARTSPFNLTQRSAEAGADFTATLAKAMAGDVTAAQQLSGLSSSYLELLKSGASTSADYEAQFFSVLSQLEAVEKLYGSQLDGADLELEEQQKSNKTLAEILAEIEKLNAEMKNAVTSNGGALQDYLAGLLSGTIRTRATGGYTPPGLTLVGEEGPELVNFTRPGMVYTAGQTQTLLRGTARSNFAGGTGGSSSEVVALRQEVYQLQRDLLLALDRIERNTRRLSDTAEQWNDEGLPAERDNNPVFVATRGHA